MINSKEELRTLPNIRLKLNDYQKLLKIILEYSLKSNKRTSFNQAIINLIREKKLDEKN